MSVPWRVAALCLAATLIYLVFVPAAHVAPSLAPARAQLLAGDVPLWNGAPLLANPYLGIAHPFTLLATLANSAIVATALRLLATLVFSFVLFRGWEVGDASALFGAIAFTFCTTHLLSWSALTLATLPLALAAAQAARPQAAGEHLRRAHRRHQPSPSSAAMTQRCGWRSSRPPDSSFWRCGARAADYPQAFDPFSPA